MQGKPTKENTIELLEEIKHLMELNAENPFKIRAFEKAAHKLGDVASDAELIKRAKEGTLTELDGIGKGIAEVLREWLIDHKSSVRDELAKALPEGLLDLTTIPGLGPKKARELIDQLGITSLGELEYACRENRLVKLKGFGEKVQDKILKGLQFRKKSEGKIRLRDGIEFSERLLSEASKKFKGIKLSETGELRRRCEILNSIEFVAEQKPGFKKWLEDQVKAEGLKVPVELHEVSAVQFYDTLWKTTGSEAHILQVGKLLPSKTVAHASEAEIYQSAKLPEIPPEAREGGDEFKLFKKQNLPLLPEDAIQGVFHNHTTRSDGTASLRDMVLEAKRLGYSYIGISDHSQTSFYAQGLKVPDLLDQEKEINKLREEISGIEIFWGIESDILKDGSLDYEAKVLKKFDFVIASVHQRMGMDESTMTERICEALRNPYTRFLGHMTGRLLLDREAYPLDIEKVIKTAAQHQVAIEINANPQRLDIDWRWGAELRKCGTEVSVNPDAHSVEGLSDVRYGVWMARKALLPPSLVINSRSVDEVRRWLARK